MEPFVRLCPWHDCQSAPDFGSGHLEPYCAYHEDELGLIWHLEIDLLQQDTPTAQRAYDRTDDPWDKGYIASLNPAITTESAA